MATIPVIDDEKMVRVTLRKVLEQAGHTITEARTGDEGIRTFRTVPVDLVMTDLIMPGKDGIQTISELRHEFPTIKIVAMSGGGRTQNPDFLKLARQYGAVDTLEKPFSNDKLVRMIDGILALPV